MTDLTEKISVIVPVYNVEKYIEEAIQSILSQTYHELEVILVDDGSTDASGSICDALAETDSRVKVFHKPNSGVSSARNLGLEKATGAYVNFMDPDDWLDHTMLEQMQQCFTPETDAVFCGYWEEPEPEENLQPICHSPQKKGTVDGREALYQCLIGMGYGYFTAVWNKMFRTDFIRRQNILFEPYAIAEDELWLAKIIPQCRRVYLLPKPMYHWRQSSGSALRGKKQYEKWFSALEAKQQVVKAVANDEQLYRLSMAKVYNDVYHVVWATHNENENALSHQFAKILKPYEKPFYQSRSFSAGKRSRYFLIRILLAMNAPICLIEKLGEINGYRLREKYIGVKK